VYKREEKRDIVVILNSSARYFLRTDYLEKIWEETVDEYATLENKLESARFDALSRTFYFHDVDERTRTVASVAMLFNMHRISTELNKVTPTPTYSYDTLKRDIEEVLSEKILMLPKDLRGHFDEEKYYPLLYEKTINNLIEEVKAFIPATEQKIIFNRLARVNPFFKSIVFEDSKIEVPEGSSFFREQFIEYFKLYLNTVEKSFPFEHALLYKPVKDVAKEELVLYNFSLTDLIDLVPTVFEKIDEVTDGGFVKKTTTLLIAEETETKNEILSSFIGQGIKDKDSIVYATSKHPSQEVWNAMLRDFGDVENTNIIDLYQSIHTSTAISEIIEDEDSTIIPINTTLFQHSIVKAIKKYPKDTHKRVVLDVYNDLMKYYRWEELFVILSRQVVGFRKWNCTSIVTLDPNLISKDNLEEVKKRFDSVIILLGKGKEVSMVISKLYGGTPIYRVISLCE
jgi:KaiC/GvpD/RAD55 family RecA-like ATPase